MGIETSFDRLLEDKFLLADGATGTTLFLKQETLQNFGI